MEEIIIQRVKEFMKSIHAGIKPFSASIGIPESTLKQQLNGKEGKGRGVQMAVITAVLSTYPNLSAEWLMRGKEPMLLEKSQENSENLYQTNTELLSHIRWLEDLVDDLRGKSSKKEAV